MIKFPSNLSPQELAEKWDEYTSPARFAGSDDTMDLIYVSHRKENTLKLVRKARTAREPFSCIFRGRINATEKGSEIVGFFAKSVFDYVIVAIILALVFYIRSLIVARGESLGAINTILVVALCASALLLYNTRAAKRRYADFIFRITGQEIPVFLTRKEKKDLEENQSK